MRYRLCPVILAAVLAVSSSASAAVCVQTDTERDNLSPAERSAVKASVEDSLDRRGMQVGSKDCITIYSIYSLRLGNSVTAHISGPDGAYRSKRAASIDGIDQAYEALIGAAVTGAAVTGAAETGATGSGRRPAGGPPAAEQPAETRLPGGNLLYVRSGVGAVKSNQSFFGLTFGLGWRYEVDHLGIDVSVLNSFLATEVGEYDNAASFVRLGGIYIFNAAGNTAFYLNGGLSWGETSFDGYTQDFFETYQGRGLQAEIGAGLEFLRTNGFALFIEPNVVLPFYKATRDGLNSDRDSYYMPSFRLSVGMGFDINPTVPR